MIECPELVELPRTTFDGRADRTIVGPDLTVDSGRSIVECDGIAFAFLPLNAVAEQLIVACGAEAAGKARL